ncbi:MAG TPA: ATP-binding cassette domain-containing protein [Candidatus Didemnitutus sp.]|nr:ATP-binding cassette domain-containing protein [Candidatus Didemnitutus sp.]
MNIVLSDLRVTSGDFSLTIDTALTGSVTAVFGPSGSGKTTLLETIAGLRRPASGRITLNGEVLTDVSSGQFSPPERRGIGYVPQDGALFPHLNVRGNLNYGRRAGNSRSSPGFERACAVLEIASLVDRPVQGLSGGEKRRVALGRALLSSPRLLLLDEPLAELDIPLRERLLPHLGRLRDEFGLPIIYVSHAPEEIVALDSDVVALESGRVTHRGRASDLFAPTGSPRLEWRKG